MNARGEPRLEPRDRRRVLIRLATLAAAGIAPGARASQPQQPAASGSTELIVPFPAGGSLDVVARIVAEALAQRVEAEITVSNIGGASGVLAVRRLMDRPPDGRTLLMGSLAQLMLAAGIEHAPNPPLAAIGKVSTTDYVIVSGEGFPADTLDDWVRLAREAPGRLSLAHPGLATMQYLTACIVAKRAGIELLFVPYSGSAPMLADVIAGHVDVALVAAPGVLSMVHAGRLKVLGLLRDTPQPALPGWAYSGQSRTLKGLDAMAWTGLFAATGISQARLGRLRSSLAEALRSPATREAIERVGGSAADPDVEADGAGFAAFVQAEIERYAVIQREAAQMR